MRRKLFAFDIDGTLLDSQGQLPAPTLALLLDLKAAGHFLVLATGRSLATAQELITTVPFENYILCNGAYAYVAHQQVFDNPLDQRELKKLARLAGEHQLDLLFQTMHGVKKDVPFIHEVNRQRQEAFSSIAIDYDFDVAQGETIYQVVVFCDRQEGALLEEEFESIRFTRWGEVAMDAIPSNGSKAHTLAILAAAEGFEVSDIVAFGDGENDIEMLQYAGHGIVMGNASDQVKQYADFITKTNDDNGICHAVEVHGWL